jgi:hypothetical protein
VADQDSEALDILRRLEPGLRTMQRDIGEMRADIRTAQQEMTGLSRSVGRIEGALPHLAMKEGVAKLPGRGELWSAIAALSAIFAIVLDGLPWLEKHLP